MQLKSYNYNNNKIAIMAKSHYDLLVKGLTQD